VENASKGRHTQENRERKDIDMTEALMRGQTATEMV
jgi:hypothetical protein